MGYQISVKGILEKNGKHLLRRNEREEWELLGGRIENRHEEMRHRLCEELSEESGVEAEIISAREPWLYNIGNSRTVIIVPFVCRIYSVPSELVDQDGGVVAWHDESEIDELSMPEGYKDSINARPPKNSFSLIPETPANLAKIQPVQKKPWVPFPEFEVLTKIWKSRQSLEDGDSALLEIGLLDAITLRQRINSELLAQVAPFGRGVTFHDVELDSDRLIAKYFVAA